jgi:hypothetical protein
MADGLLTSPHPGDRDARRPLNVRRSGVLDAFGSPILCRNCQLYCSDLANSGDMQLISWPVSDLMARSTPNASAYERAYIRRINARIAVAELRA